MQGEDANGNKTMDMPVTNIKYVEGAESVVTSIEQGDGTIKVTTKIDGEVTEKEIEAGKVKSVNGKTGDVVVGEVTDIDIDGTTITATFADKSTKDIKIPDGVVPKRYVVETFKSGYDWYEVYNDGWVRQGGWVAGVATSETKTITFLKPFADTTYTVYGAYCSDSSANSFTIRVIANVATNSINSATSMKILISADRGSKFWVAEGQGV